MTNLRRIVEEQDTWAGATFHVCIQVLILCSLITFSVETLPNISPVHQAWLHQFDDVVTILFTIEYVLRLLVSKHKLGYIFSFFGLIDLVAIVPFYLASSINLRAIRIFRLLRIFRVLKLVRYSKAISRFHRAFILAKEELILFFSVSMVLFYLAAVGIYYCEKQSQPEQFASIFHSLWWAVITLTTVGYGDVYPVTLGGRLFTFMVLMLGLGVVAVPSGLMASALSEARKIQEQEDLANETKSTQS